MSNDDLARQAKAKRMLEESQQSVGPFAPNVKGSILPLSTDPQGNMHLDLKSGITGAVWDAVTLPGDVLTGKADPDDPAVQGRIWNLATMISTLPPGSFGAARIHPITGKAVPSADELKAVADAGYNRARAMGVDYSAGAVVRLAKDAQNSLETEGFIAANSPKTYAVIDELQNPPSGAVVSLTGLTAARQALQRVTGDSTDQEAARRAIQTLDGFLTSPPPTAVIRGPAEAAGRELMESNANYAAAKRSQGLTGDPEGRAVTSAAGRAETRAAATYSGGNVGNALRQRLATLLSDRKALRGWSPAEVKALKYVVEGDWTTNIKRSISNFLGGGGGLGRGAASAGGAAVGGMIGGWPGGAVGSVAVPAVGAAFRHLYNKSVQEHVSALDEMLRMRSPMARDLQANAIAKPDPTVLRSALSKAFLIMLQDSKASMQPPAGKGLRADEPWPAGMI